MYAAVVLLDCTISSTVMIDDNVQYFESIIMKRKMISKFPQKIRLIGILYYEKAMLICLTYQFNFQRKFGLFYIHESWFYGA